MRKDKPSGWEGYADVALAVAIGWALAWGAIVWLA
jgi:hypothetical protein